MLMKKYLVNTLLVAVVFCLMAVNLVLTVFYPDANLPQLDVPTICALSLVALVLEYYTVGKRPRSYVINILLGTLTFGLLPLMAGFTCIHQCWKFFVVGGAVFGVTMLLYDSITHWLHSGRGVRAAAAVCAFALYLASQIFSGMFI